MLIDKQKTALVVIDLQKGITATPALPHPANEVIANASKLARAFPQTSNAGVPCARNAIAR